jgi:fatty-acyl-CoA synthase
VVAREGSSVSASDLRTFLSDKVVRWWLPERWTFIDEIPRTSVGKYDKKTIRSRYAEGVYQVSEARD